MPRMTIPRLTLALVAAAALAPASAAAAPPANDARAAAAEIASLPSTQSATTAEATTEALEPASPCQCNGGSVWYRYVAATDGRLVLTLTAAGDLDAALDAFLAQRSQLTLQDSDVTDEQGTASVTVPVRAGQAYLVRVAQRLGSAPGTFSLAFDAAAPAVRPPGQPLGRRGATGTLDRVLKPAAAFSHRMSAGTTYRINIVPVGAGDDGGPACRTRLDLFAPGTRSFSSSPVRTLGCDAYVLFTPGRGEGGLYVLRVSAPSSVRGPQRFHLQVAPADASDTAPGLPLANHARVRGALHASGVDRVDLYRFTVTSRSELKLALSGTDRPLTLRLRDDRGRRISTGDGEISRRLRPGRYFVSVTAPAGVDTRYTLLRSSRTITSARVTIAGAARAGGQLGRTLTVGVRVGPAVAGTARVTVERLDPEFGWQYVRTVDVRVAGGQGSFGLRPPAVGRFRVSARYLGTRDSAPSGSGFALVLVVGG
ncbi:MAG: hypothetical protein QOG35_2324 [Solirubrobacteraceae bacterium]|nr:hypothetical protein [Solirubrobacteraceae bacterium]